MAKNQITKTNDEVVGNYLKKFGVALKDYKMREYNDSSFLKSAMLCIMQNQDLVEATKTDIGKRTLFDALRYAATTGLSLNPQEGKAALIVYKSKNNNLIVNYQVMKNGMIDLAMESGKVEFMTADYIRKNDDFSLNKSVNGDVYNFKPELDNRGPLRGFFAALKLKSGETHVKYMNVEEMNEHREKYSSHSQMPEIGYGIKTVMKALLRSVSISSDLDNAIGADDFYEADFKVVESRPTSADMAKEKLDSKKDDSEKQDKADAQGELL